MKRREALTAVLTGTAAVALADELTAQYGPLTNADHIRVPTADEMREARDYVVDGMPDDVAEKFRRLRMDVGHELIKRTGVECSSSFWYGVMVGVAAVNEKR